MSRFLKLKEEETLDSQFVGKASIVPDGDRSCGNLQPREHVGPDTDPSLSPSR